MNFKEVAKRAETGPLMETNDFLMKRVASNVMKLGNVFKQYNR